MPVHGTKWKLEMDTETTVLMAGPLVLYELVRYFLGTIKRNINCIQISRWKPKRTLVIIFWLNDQFLGICLRGTAMTSWATVIEFRAQTAWPFFPTQPTTTSLTFSCPICVGQFGCSMAQKTPMKDPKALRHIRFQYPFSTDHRMCSIVNQIPKINVSVRLIYRRVGAQTWTAFKWLTSAWPVLRL